MERANFDWDTSRTTRRPGQAPYLGAKTWFKVLGWTLAILIGVPAILAGLAILACLVLLATA